MQLLLINHTDDDRLGFVQQLYEAGFPLFERREWNKLSSMIGNGKMQLGVLEDENIAVGFMVWWELGDWHFLEHFAVDAALRGKNYGSLALQLFLEKSRGKIVFEVEPEHDAESSRRIRFYERFGLKVMPFEYQQPPYRSNGSPIPMHLMVGGSNLDIATFNSLQNLIRENIYEPYY